MKDTEGIRLIVGLYWSEIKRHPAHVIAVLLLVPAGVFFNTFAGTYIVSSVINYFSAHGTVPINQLWSTFGWDIIGFLASAILGELIIWRLILWLVWKLETKVTFALYNRCFDFLTQQSSQFHANKFGGSLVSQTNKFTGTYVRFADTFVWNVLTLVSALVFTLTILGTRVPWFAAGLAVVSAVFITVSIANYSRIAHLNEIGSNADTRLSGQIADMISNVLAVKSFSAEKLEARRFSKLNSQSAKASNDIMSATIRRDVGFAASLSTLLLLMFISILVGQAIGGITVGTMVLMLSYSLNLFGQLWQVNGIARSFNRGYGDALPMAQILAENISVVDAPDAEKSLIKDGHINFQAVDFTYQDSDEPLFKNFNLDIKPGERVGLVGRSGSGKTTITNLLLRFLDIESGAISIDDQNIAKLHQTDLRAGIAYVPQQPLLFHRSLSENIAYGKPNATHLEIVEAARLANALEFIDRLPQKFDTLVGERGVKLSGGQRQRIAIARAIIKEAPILILDEATSALDSESEKLIQDSMTDLMRGRTSIVIAHRLSTIAKLDRIIVLDEGKVIEDGSHEGLLAANGTYAKLWAHQSGGFIEED